MTVNESMRKALAWHERQAELRKASCAGWEEERQRHADFFGGLTPQQEYKQHAQVRKAINDKQEDEVV